MIKQNSISAVIPAYNAEETLTRALDSVVAQTFPAKEIIIVNDGSTDGTAALAASYRGHGVRLLNRAERGGASVARNDGCAAAQGEWIAFLDADDEWLPAKLEKQVQALSFNPDTSFVFCASEEFDHESQSLGDTFRSYPVSSGGKAWKALLAHNFVATPTVLARRELLLQLGGFDEGLKIAEDQDMWIRLALAGPIAYVPESLVCVHMRPNSLSSWVGGAQSGYTLPMVERHLAALRGRLTEDEVRRIRGTRLHNSGLIEVAHGDLKRGLPLLLRSAILGYRPLRGLEAIVKASLRAFLSKSRSIGVIRRQVN